ncbi:MAG: hypothetical protein WBQ14_02445 [Gaiellaceae bacterium]
MTTTLAIIGAITGTAALLLDALRYFRDRPKLVIAIKVNASLGNLPLVGLDVANRGRQATTIVKAALQADGEATIMKDGIEFATGKVEQDLSGGALTVVAPGGVARFRWEVDHWPGIIGLDDPVRPYVIDAHGRTTWGEAFPLMRVITGTGWRPSPGTVDPRLLQPAKDPVKPFPVESAWKLWKPKYLRRPQALPRFPDIRLG